MKEVLIIGSLVSICIFAVATIETGETKFPEKNCKFETLYLENYV